MRIRLMRLAITITLIVDIALLSLLGLMIYNKYFRYEFRMVFIGVRASYVYEGGERIDLILDERAFLRDHLFELPNCLKSDE